MAVDKLRLRQPTEGEIAKSETCSVSNFEFHSAKDTPFIDYKGKNYYFCCIPCVDDFKKDPDEYSR
ncbi:MAG: YHS domain-containing protein [Nitrospirota bacterium]|nr:YHS domain-containing protein [Nitrospirota bacterium]